MSESAPLPDEKPSRGLAPWVRIVLAAVAVAGLAWGLRKPAAPPPPAPLKTAYWYWHQPFRLDPAEREQLAAARVERLYVLAGTVARRGKGLALISRQRWAERSPVPLLGVFRVEASALPLLLSSEGGAQVQALIREAELPADAIGVQWDADVPTKRLAEYRRFLQQARAVLPENRLLSITALPDWLSSPEYAGLCEAVDEVAPQFYGNSWPRDGREPPPLWEADGLVEQARRAAAGRARVWVGLPAYGRCVVADAEGRFGGVRHDLDPESLLDDPLWEVGHASTRAATLAERGTPVAYEDTLLLRSREETLAAPVLFRKGTSLWFQWPRVEGLQAAAGALARAAIPGVEGVSLFRWPIRKEALALAPVEATATPAASGVDLSMRLERAGERLVVAIRNEGVDSPALAAGVRVEITPGGGEVVTRSEGVGYLGEERASLLRADRVRFQRPVLRPGTRWVPCEVRRPQGIVTAQLSWTDAQGARMTAARAGAEGEKGAASDASR